MNDSMFINSKLPNNFWAETMDIVNYLENRLLTKYIDKKVIILEETWTDVRQNLVHV